MNKLLFIWQKQFDHDIILVANNERDLIDYLLKEYDNILEAHIDNNEIRIKEKYSDKYEYVEVKWIKHI